MRLRGAARPCPTNAPVGCPLRKKSATKRRIAGKHQKTPARRRYAFAAPAERRVPWAAIGDSPQSCAIICTQHTARSRGPCVEASPSLVYGAALLMRFGVTPIPGSNPGASALYKAPTVSYGWGFCVARAAGCGPRGGVRAPAWTGRGARHAGRRCWRRRCGPGRLGGPGHAASVRPPRAIATSRASQPLTRDRPLHLTAIMLRSHFRRSERVGGMDFASRRRSCNVVPAKATGQENAGKQALVA